MDTSCRRLRRLQLTEGGDLERGEDEGAILWSSAGEEAHQVDCIEKRIYENLFFFSFDEFCKSIEFAR